MCSAGPASRRGSATRHDQHGRPGAATSATYRTGRDLGCCAVAAVPVDPASIDPMGGGGGDHQAATERHVRPVREAPGGLRHVCRSNSARRATIKLQPVLGGCARCGKQYGGRNGNPLTHVCSPRDGDFRRRKTAQVRKVQASARATVRAAERDKQRAKISAVRERERQRSRAQVARLKASYEARLGAAKAKASQKAPQPKTTADKPRKPPHEYQSCTNKDCQRPICLAFKEGYRDGHRDGYKQGFEQGWQQGYAKGYPDGIAACPRAHK